MMISDEQMRNGLTPDHDLFFTCRPKDPAVRESTSLWLYEENGRFALPRIGIEAEASSWENRLFQGNFSVAGGRVLDGSGRGPAHSPFGPDGRPTVLGAGPISFRCIEPFRKWQVQWDGPAIDGTVDQQIGQALDANGQVALRCDIELIMAAPAWVQDNSPEKIALMDEAEKIAAGNMGIGWRCEQLLRAEGSFSIDGEMHEFKGTGLRIKRQSIRPMAGFTGHCWQSAIFPDGRGFGYIAYPPREDGYQFNEGYIWQDGKMHDARVIKAPWLRRIIGEGDDCSLELESELGISRIDGVTRLNTFRVGNPEMGGLTLHQGGALYSWNGQSAYGMIERSAQHSLTTIG